MAIPIKFVASQSTGTPFETGETRSIDVTAEALTAVDGYEGATVTYTATVLDDQSDKLPATFTADLEINSTKVLTDVAFDVAVYDQATGELSLEWTVPADVGTFTVKLVWAEQLI